MTSYWFKSDDNTVMNDLCSAAHTMKSTYRWGNDPASVYSYHDSVICDVCAA